MTSTVTPEQVIARAVQRFVDGLQPMIRAMREAARVAGQRYVAFLRTLSRVAREQARAGVGDPPDETGRWESYRCATALGLDELHALCPQPDITGCACRCHGRRR